MTATDVVFAVTMNVRMTLPGQPDDERLAEVAGQLQAQMGTLCKTASAITVAPVLTTDQPPTAAGITRAVTAAADLLAPLGSVTNGGLSFHDTPADVVEVMRKMPGAAFTLYVRGGPYGFLSVPIGKITAVAHRVPPPPPRLTKPQRAALRALADGRPREGGPATAHGFINGRVGATLVELRYVRGVGSGPVRYTITEAGRAALASAS